MHSFDSFLPGGSAALRDTAAQPTGQATATAPSLDSATDSALVCLGRLLQAKGYQFTTVTPATHARVNSRPENAQARSLPAIFGWNRPFSSELLPPGFFRQMQQAGIALPDGQLWRSGLRASTLDEWLFFHSAYPTEAADAVFFGPDSYRFVSALNQQLGSSGGAIRRAVDIGCGAGPGALALTRLCPQAEVLGVDINPQALCLARVNAMLADVSDRLQLCASDLLQQVSGQFDLIVANPPYLADPGKRAYRDGGGPLGASLSLQIVETALERLNPGGRLLLYTGVAILDGQDPFRAAVAQLLQSRQLSWHYRELDPDVFGEELLHFNYASAERIAVVLLSLTLPGGQHSPQEA